MQWIWCWYGAATLNSVYPLTQTLHCVAALVQQQHKVSTANKNNDKTETKTLAYDNGKYQSLHHTFKSCEPRWQTRYGWASKCFHTACKTILSVHKAHSLWHLPCPPARHQHISSSDYHFFSAPSRTALGSRNLLMHYKCFYLLPGYTDKLSFINLLSVEEYCLPFSIFLKICWHNFYLI